MWYPYNLNELNNDLNKYLNQEQKIIPKNKINGIIVPHAGYIYSGKIAGNAFQLLKDKEIDLAIILGPSHYKYTNQTHTHNKTSLITPLGEINIIENNFSKIDISNEHSITNQLPFIQKLNIKKILPLMIGEIDITNAKKLAEELNNLKTKKTIFIFSTDLSHFKTYEKACKIDTNTINTIENLTLEKFLNLNACGKNPLLILFFLCKLLNTKPILINYKNSGDITGQKDKVVGYASFYF